MPWPCFSSHVSVLIFLPNPLSVSVIISDASLLPDNDNFNFVSLLGFENFHFQFRSLKVKVKILRETLKLDKDKIIWKWKNLLLPKCEKSKYYETSPSLRWATPRSRTTPGRRHRDAKRESYSRMVLHDFSPCSRTRWRSVTWRSWSGAR